MRAVHASAFDASLVAPVRPKHPTLQRIQRYRPRLLDAVAYQGLPHISLEIGQLDGIFSGIGPINVIVDPVDCQSIRRGEVVLDDDRALVPLVYRSSKRHHIKFQSFQSSLDTTKKKKKLLFYSYNDTIAMTYL